MPDVSLFEEAIEGLKNGVYPALGVTIGPYQVEPGAHIAKADTQETPVLIAPPNLPHRFYTVICVDLDAPYISWNALSPALHWAQPGLRIELPGRELKSSVPFIAEYTGAGPPPGAAPHRYVFLLYSQKPGSAVPNQNSVGVLSRMRFDIEGFKKKLGLERIEAVNHFSSS
ncbi:hypothetical protein N7470_002416 [Penicillium chermesinum]|nr:hypothetical protein N7470_002416 [Penicillium chermesinum]